MSYLMNTTPEAAVSNANFTPEQLAEAAKILARQQQEAAEVVAEAVSPISQQKKEELIAAFNAVIENPRYWENPKRIKRLEDALNLPKFDDPSMRQFCISAEDELLKIAAKISVETAQPLIFPTEEQIIALAKTKQAAKEAKDAKRKARKTDTTQS